MTEKTTFINLPSKLPLLRPRRHETNPISKEEFSIYYANVIYPYHPGLDVIAVSEYGANYGSFWRINDYPEEDRFLLTLSVYDEWGEKLDSRTVEIELVEQGVNEPEFTLLPIGDSMTHRHLYIDHLYEKLPNLRTAGTRHLNGNTRMEGRGGWSAANYVFDHADVKNGPSPFVFPLGIRADEYYGDISFEEKKKTPEKDPYALDGFEYSPIKDGQVFLKDEKLFRFRNGNTILENDDPVWEFSFSKYLEKNHIERPDAVSILLGANDWQTTDYELFDEKLDRYISNLSIMIDSIRSYDPTLPVVINMPVFGAESYAWGLAKRNSAKRYHHHAAMANRRLLATWDGRENEDIFISPMMVNLDPVYGFERGAFKPNLYSDCLVEHQINWVHPSRIGYMQMADALAGALTRIRNLKREEKK